ncbi:ABC-three component system middle component 6 [Pleionea sp. CnH1-48]|uniref:ABC-three component system middle component 6 n=1 Tax=Pleionea sp. CnH1-48 TaxID=2954494 RepID=UPI002097538F|nr:ABC-three component system middle component 6 [Pleionea sp. CnH1-48]MCO7226629.1 hypothetical protein [Pleionea sp. CnH1-48]
MILGKDVHPEQKLYYWGALVIEFLNDTTELNHNYYNIYENIKEKYGISIESFSLTLDWLYILGVIDNDKGKIRKCF